MRVEYQIIVDTKSGLCESKEAFKSLLNINSKFRLASKEIQFDGSIFCFELKLSKYPERHQNIFDFILHIDKHRDIDKYTKLLRLIREIIHKTNSVINVLWDDVSVKFCNLSYPLVHSSENLLRKLITKFMITSVGLNWTDESLPKEIKTTLKNGKKDRSSYSSILHNIDFIQLAHFLFKPYGSKPIEVFYREFKSLEDAPIDKEYLERYIPKSNWERYFKSIVNCDDEFFNKRWSKLYDLRCKIAHNNFFTKVDYNEVVELTEGLNNIINKALLQLNKVHVPSEEKDELVENTVINTSESHAIFLEKWKELEAIIISYAEQKEGIKEKSKEIIKDKIQNYKSLSGKIPFPYRKKINHCIQIRNQIVHKGAILKDETIVKYINILDEITKSLK